MKSICAYIRVSTDDQTELSPTSQRKLIQEYCLKNGYIIADVYEDLGISGKTADKRPAFRQMIAMCKSKEHPYDAIVVWKFSRFARNQEESIVYKSMLRKIGIDVISISEPISEGLGGKLTEAILEIMDEYYSINLSQEVRRGMTEGALQGRVMSAPPFGYSIENKILVPNDDAKTVQLIFDMYVNQGYSILSIASILNQKGYRTSRGNMWENRTIKYILQHPVYIGKMRWNYATHDGKAGTTRINNSSDWIIVDGNHEPIISEELYQHAQDKLALLPPTRQRKPAQSHYLSGLIKCSKCGGNMIYHSGTNKSNSMLVCHSGRRGKCTGTARVLYKLEADFIDGLKLAVINGNYQLTRKATLEVDATQELDNQLAQLDKKYQRVKESYINGIDTMDEYKANKALIDNERANLLARIEKARSGQMVKPTTDIKSDIESVIELIQSDAYDVKQKSDALHAVIDKVVYDKANDTMDFYFFG